MLGCDRRERVMEMYQPVEQSGSNHPLAQLHVKRFVQS